MLRRIFSATFLVDMTATFLHIGMQILFCTPNLGNLDNFSYGMRKWQEIRTGQPRPGNRAACSFEGNCIFRKCVKASWFRGMSCRCPHMVLAGLQTCWRIKFCRCRKNCTGSVASLGRHFCSTSHSSCGITRHRVQRFAAPLIREKLRADNHNIRFSWSQSTCRKSMSKHIA